MESARTSVYCRRQPAIVSEIIDGEVVMIDLDSGSYFSATGSGAHIWAGIEAGESIEQIEERVLAAWDAEAGDVARDVQAFMGRLLAERLVVQAGASAAPPAPRPPAGQRAAYVPPCLERFDDMQALLLADPIHDVNETGWPHLGPGGHKA